MSTSPSPSLSPSPGAAPDPTTSLAPSDNSTAFPPSSTSPSPATPSVPPPSTSSAPLPSVSSPSRSAPAIPSVPPPSSTSPMPVSPSVPPPSTSSPPLPSASSPPRSAPAIPTAPSPSNSSSPTPSASTPSSTPSTPSFPSQPPPSTPNSAPAPAFGGSSTAPSSPKTPSTPNRGYPSPPSPSTNSPSSSVPTGLVVGVAVGAVVILLVLSTLCICCRKKRKRRGEQYYVPPPPPVGFGRKDNGYGAGPQHWQQSADSPADHVEVMRLKPSPPPQPPLHAPKSPPQPPAPFINNSGGSGTNQWGSETPLPPPPGVAFRFSKSTFTYDELAKATDGFSDANLLGQGGFGYVHRGILPNGKEIAVKQMKSGSGQGEREFQAEVEIISRVHHRNLVSLVGYCMTRNQRLLVYEFVPNNTLEFHLHGKGRPTMEWPTRLKIALGSARGLSYLHEDCDTKIIHRDIKAANILLDFKFEAKVADFGLAKFSSDINTPVSTRVMGTFGYLAPEYASTGKLTDRSDVFSFGVVLLELITGRRPVDTSNSFVEDSLVDWARPLLSRAWEDQNFDSLVDRRLQHDYDPSEMARMVACAATCVRHSARRRPRMTQVVRALEGDVSLADLNEGIRQGHSIVYSSQGSTDYDSAQYKEDIKRFRKMALERQQYGGSGDYSEATSEYGLYPSGSSSEGQNTREIDMRKMKNSRGFSATSYATDEMEIGKKNS